MRRYPSNTRRAALVSAILFSLAFAAGAGAEPPGFMIGLDLHTSHIGAEKETVDSPDNSVFVDETGGGVALRFGYLWAPGFFLRLSMTASGHDTNKSDVDVIYSRGTVDAGYLFRDGEEVRPYLYGGIGGFNLQSRQDNWKYDTSGPGAVLGGGIYWFATPSFALDFGGTLEFMNWEQTRSEVEIGNSTIVVETPVDQDGSAAKIEFGASYWF